MVGRDDQDVLAGEALFEHALDAAQLGVDGLELQPAPLGGHAVDVTGVAGDSKVVYRSDVASPSPIGSESNVASMRSP